VRTPRVSTDCPQSVAVPVTLDARLVCSLCYVRCRPDARCAHVALASSKKQCVLHPTTSLQLQVCLQMCSRLVCLVVTGLAKPGLRLQL
jgi:hypothetical protein